MIPKRLWNLFVTVAVLSVALLFLLWNHVFTRNTWSPVEADFGPEVNRPSAISKNKDNVKVSPRITDNFPLLASAKSGIRLPAVPSWNKPPTPHVAEKTPLFIGFTRNWPMLQQCILSYITSGWPPEDIFVVDNTGTMKSNFPPNPQLTLQNPFYLNVERLTKVFGVNVISTPTLLTFAQLQNFYIFECLERGWDYYFWGHMDIIALTEEQFIPEGQPFRSVYGRAVDKFREVTSPSYLKRPNGEQGEWAMQLFEYDWLVLNNVKSFIKLGAWDTFVGYYKTDCDMYERFNMTGMETPEKKGSAGRISDVGGTIDLNLLFRRQIDHANPPKSIEELDLLPEDDRGGPGYDHLWSAIKVVQDLKQHEIEADRRNSWQARQTGGQGEPFYRDLEGFQKALKMSITCGEEIYYEKWGQKECSLRDYGLKLTDAWQVPVEHGPPGTLKWV